jgi:hypothetical protein
MTLLFKDDKRRIDCPACGKIAVPDRENITEGFDHFTCLSCGVVTTQKWQSLIESEQIFGFNKSKTQKKINRKRKKEELERQIEKIDLMEESGYNKEEEEHEEKQSKSCCGHGSGTHLGSSWTVSSATSPYVTTSTTGKMY